MGEILTKREVYTVTSLAAAVCLASTLHIADLPKPDIGSIESPESHQHFKNYTFPLGLLTQETQRVNPNNLVIPLKNNPYDVLTPDGIIRANTQNLKPDSENEIIKPKPPISNKIKELEPAIKKTLNIKPEGDTFELNPSFYPYTTRAGVSTIVNDSNGIPDVAADSNGTIIGFLEDPQKQKSIAWILIAAHALYFDFNGVIKYADGFEVRLSETDIISRGVERCFSNPKYLWYAMLSGWKQEVDSKTLYPDEAYDQAIVEVVCNPGQLSKRGSSGIKSLYSLTGKTVILSRYTDAKPPLMGSMGPITLDTEIGYLIYFQKDHPTVPSNSGGPMTLPEDINHVVAIHVASNEEGRKEGAKITGLTEPLYNSLNGRYDYLRLVFGLNKKVLIPFITNGGRLAVDARNN